MKKKRILATVLSMCLLAGTMSMAACGGGSDGGTGGGGNGGKFNTESSTKLGIKVKNFGGGPGNVWLEEAAERFAELKKDEQYGDKTGVYIKYEATYNQNTGSMDSDSTNIFFDERASDPSVLAQSGLLLNLDDIVKDKTREGGSLESKIFESAKGGIRGNDGSYYALPHYEFYTGLAYNRTTFDELCAYFAADDEENVYTYSSKYGQANFVLDAETEKSVGPDGKTGVIDGVDYSADDGLPRSLDEFILLCDYIKTESDGSIAPLTVSGKYYKQVEYLLIGLWSSMAGAEQMRNYYNCTGEIEVVERDASGNLQYTNENLFTGIDYVKKPKTKMVTMAEDGSDGWMGNDMAAKYYALAMLEVITTEGFFSKTVNSEKDHWQTQMDLYMDGKANTNNSAMLVEGSYWYNESDEKGGFNYYETYVGKNRKDLDVQWMSLPTSVYAENAVGKDACFLDCGQAYAMINGNVQSNPALKQACLDFIAFCYSEAELRNFTVETGLARAINYQLNEEEKEEMGIYSAGLWDRRDNANGSNVVAWSGTTQTFKNAKSALKIVLDAGVLTDGQTKAWVLLNNGDSVSEVFNACSFYGNWSY